MELPEIKQFDNRGLEMYVDLYSACTLCGKYRDGMAILEIDHYDMDGSCDGYASLCASCLLVLSKSLLIWEQGSREDDERMSIDDEEDEDY